MSGIFGRLKRRPESVLAFCVNVLTLAGTICFLIAIWLNTAVFSAWGLNFLQLATAGDVVNSGLDIFFRMLVPLLILGLVAIGAFLRPAKGPVDFSVLAVLALVAIAFAISSGQKIDRLNSEVQHRFEEYMIALQTSTPPPIWSGDPSEYSTYEAQMEEYRLQQEIDAQNRKAASDVFSMSIITADRKSALPETMRNWSWFASQAIFVVALASILSRTGEGWLSERRYARLLTISFSLLGAAIVPVWVYSSIQSALVTNGFHRDHLVMIDCNPGNLFEPAQLLWLGDRAFVIRCATGIQVVLRDGAMRLGDRGMLHMQTYHAEEQGRRAEQAALDEEMRRLRSESEAFPTGTEIE